MCSLLKRAAAALLALAGLGGAVAQTPYPGIGRTATPAELKAWDIDVRPDFKGLPKGTGSVSQGQDVWEARCAACHGIFGESNEVFSPLVGGTTAEDIKTGRVARLNDRTFPGRTTLMKVSTVSTLWDYINRAMPWNAPKSLKTDEVYAVTAYLLNLGGIVADDFTLSDTNIADVQKRLPNRNGVTTAHAMWPGSRLGRAGNFDVKAKACMHDCDAEPKVASLLPDFARNNNGNLADQQRLVGPQRGVDTAHATSAAPAPAPLQNAASAALALVKKHSCTACHGIAQKLVGPGFNQVAAKYGTRSDAEAYLAGKIRNGGQGLWGAIPMPAQTLPDADLKAIAAWLATGATNH